jgi:hypothetical protein
MTTTSAFVSTVKADRTIVLPEGIPVGARVAVVLLPQEELQEESAARNMRFQSVMDAIRAAINSNFEAPAISNKDLDQLIQEARQGMQSAR